MPSTAEIRPASYPSINYFQKESVSKALKQRDGELLVCDVSLYQQLYQEHLQKSGGNQSLAKKYIFEAIKKDGVALMQENISALSQGGKTLFDLESRARMQLTPTQNTYLLHQEEIVDEKTGQRISSRKMVSPEHAYIGRSVTEALTGWRRGNDARIMAQNEKIFTNDKYFSATKTKTLVWGSPIAKSSEGELVHKYNGEYGYLYVGQITEKAGSRKMILHSYKNDMSSEAYQRFMAELPGQEFFAGLSDQTTIETMAVDRVMSTSILSDDTYTPEQIYQRMFKVKKEVDGVDTMFGIDQKTLLAIQDPQLRQRLEDEASTEVAIWLVGQLTAGVDTKLLQQQIKGKYISATQKTINKYKTEQMLKNTTDLTTTGEIVSEDRFDINALKAMKKTTGAFCGSWDTGNSEGGLATGLSGFKTFTARGWGGESKSGKETVYCDTCRDNMPAGSCKLCAVCFPE